MSEVLKRKSSLYLKIICLYEKTGSTEAVPDYYKFTKAGFYFHLTVLGIYLPLDSFLAISEKFYSLKIKYGQLHRFG